MVTRTFRRAAAFLLTDRTVERLNPRIRDDVVRVYGRLLGYVRPHRWVLSGVLVVTVGFAAIGGGVPWLTSGLVEQLVAEQLEGTADGGAWLIPAAIILLFTVRGALDFLAVYGLTWVGRSVVRDLRADLFDSYLALPARYFDRNATGTMISKLTYNTEQVAEAISNAVVVLVRDSLQILVQIVMMLLLSVYLTLTVAIVGPIVALLLTAMSRAFRRHSRRIQNSMGDVTRIAEQSLQGQRIVKLFDGQEYERERFGQINRLNFRLNLRLAATRAAGDTLTQYTVIFALAVVIFLTFSDWILNDVTAATFFGFVTAMGMLLTSLKRLVNVNAVVQKGIAAADSLFEVIDEPPERDSGRAPLERAAGHIEYRDVQFGYDSGRGPVLGRINLEIPAGKTVALVGHSGSGKSTFAGLLPRFYDVSAGAILLDGRDIREYPLAALRRQIAFVSQDVVLFDGTIAENIAYGGLASRSRAEVEQAAAAAHVTEFASELEGGLDSQVGERGSRLSGGQRQRVAIARALLKDAPILILDEATSALDSESERRVQSALERLMTGRTTLVIAHRLSTIERAHIIVVMQNGSIVETGSHRELLECGGYYSALHRMQFAE